MKQILTSIILMMSMCVLSAQTNPKNETHQSFKGIPIDGTLNEYVNKMKAVGFEHMGTEDGVALLSGDFAGYKNCTVGVSTLKQKDLVSQITVMFPEKETWSTLSGDYYWLKELLTEKYGQPSESEEKFDSNMKPSDDNKRMFLVKLDNCKFHTTYETENGSIDLSIEHDGASSCFVLLRYSDKINGKILRAKALGDL